MCSIGEEIRIQIAYIHPVRVMWLIGAISIDVVSGNGTNKQVLCRLTVLLSSWQIPGARSFSTSRSRS